MQDLGLLLMSMSIPAYISSTRGISAYLQEGPKRSDYAFISHSNWAPLAYCYRCSRKPIFYGRGVYSDILVIIIMLHSLQVEFHMNLHIVEDSVRKCARVGSRGYCW